MLILECSQGCYGRTEGSVTLSLRNFVGEGIMSERVIIMASYILVRWCPLCTRPTHTFGFL